jgi:uncharacterized protein (DUF924 family)
MLRLVADAAEDVLTFWFGAPGSLPLANAEHWFAADPAFDEAVRARFEGLVARAAAGELEAWRESPPGALALVVTLDQFPRNLYRGSPRAFACDPAALDVALDAQARGFDRALSPVERWFLYLPLMHAESLARQQQSVALFEALAAEAPPSVAGAVADAADFARRHRDVIARFGRFPHRNRALGRASTAEEAAFLEQPGSSF